MDRYTKLAAILRKYGSLELGEASFGACLIALSDAGFSPGIYKRGKLWRMHINCATNCWHDGRTPASAFRGVIKQELKKERKNNV